VIEAIESAKKIVASLDLDFARFSVQGLVQKVEQIRNRRIYLFSLPMAGGMDGAWISDAECPNEYILYDAHLSPIHQVHTQLHELGHMLCNHETLRLSRDGLEGLLKAVQRQRLTAKDSELLMRAWDTDDGREAEAEAVAMVIQSSAIQASRLETLSWAASDNDVVSRFLHDMGVF
jgi:hypothetical protein